MNRVRNVNGNFIDLDRYIEITDQEFIDDLEQEHFDKNTNKYVFNQDSAHLTKVGEKWYRTETIIA
jgi:hypothetical protein